MFLGRIPAGVPLRLAVISTESKNEYSRDIRNRFSRNLGHLAKVKEMIDNGEDFESVVLQLRAARNVLAGIYNALLAERVQAEVDGAIESGDSEQLREFYKYYSKYF